MTGASLCSGIGAAEQAMPWVNWRWCAEIEPFPSAVLAQRFGHPNMGDITAPDFIDRARSFGPIDILAAGTPCQAFSVAGLRQSLGDDRGNLTLRFVEIVHAIDPRIVLWENVPGVLSTADNAFGCFLAALVGHSAPITFPASHPRWRDGKDGRYFAWPNAGVVAGPRRIAAFRVLAEFWSEQVKGYHLNDVGLESLRKYVRRFGPGEVLEAIRVSSKYLQYDKAGKITEQSVETAFDKVGGICRIREAQRENPDIKELYYLRGIVRHRCGSSMSGYFDPDCAMQLLRDAYEAGAPVALLKEECLHVSNWTNFKRRMEALTV